VSRPAKSKRARGSIRRRGNSYLVEVYAGIDPVTGRRLYLNGSTTDEKEAERIRTRLLAQVDEQRHARTNATLGYVVREWLRLTDLEDSTRQNYEMYNRVYIEPTLGQGPIKVPTKVLEEFYADLRRCRARCDGKPAVDHRIDGPHECREVKHRRRPGRPPAGGYPPHDCAATGCKVIECQPHQCRPLADWTILKIHFIISGAQTAAVRWEWIDRSTAELAKKPEQPRPKPDPPTTDQAARIIAAAWNADPAWGTLVWLVMVTGLRRGELLGLRWRNLDLAAGALRLLDTKTGEMRQVSVDAATVEILTEHRARYEAACRQVDIEATEGAYVFSYSATHDRPCNGSGVTHRYARMCAGLGLDSHLHALRHYSATELLTAGVDVRTVGGRLGHAPGTTLRVYAAWVNQADRRAAEILGGRLRRPSPAEGPSPTQTAK
jgi:integrase